MYLVLYTRYVRIYDIYMCEGHPSSSARLRTDTRSPSPHKLPNGSVENSVGSSVGLSVAFDRHFACSSIGNSVEVLPIRSLVPFAVRIALRSVGRLAIRSAIRLLDRTFCSPISRFHLIIVIGGLTSMLVAFFFSLFSVNNNLIRAGPA